MSCMWEYLSSKLCSLVLIDCDILAIVNRYVYQWVCSDSTQ